MHAAHRPSTSSEPLPASSAHCGEDIPGLSVDISAGRERALKCHLHHTSSQRHPHLLMLLRSHASLK